MRISTTEFQNKLSQLAYLCVKVGLNIQRSQELIITAPLEASALVQHITRIAYQQGSKLVTCFYEDPRMIYDRFKYAEDDLFDYVPEWIFRRMSEAFENGAARLYVVGPYPDLLSGVPAEKIIRAHKSMALASKVEVSFISASRINWSTIPFVTKSWAKKVFPDLPLKEAAQKLWETVFDVTRVSCPDPCRAWKEHNQALNSRRDFLQNRKLASLHFYDGQTDLKVGLADGHNWVGGTVIAANGVEGNCNIPTEELFTCPHRERTNGKIFFSKPLALAGTLVENLCVEFCDGSVELIKAEKGQEMFEKLISSDEGARRLGEIALVSNSSPISRSNILFYSALFDENAASHVAFGQSYATCLRVEPQLFPIPEKAGANQSSIHIDCMFGNSSMSVDGISETGLVEPIMRGGEFVI